MLTHSGEDDIVAYVTGEYSEACPALHADLVFAKDRFQTICQRENITYFPYDTLLDVTNRLRILLADGRGLRKRRRAELRRRQAFLCE
jgi:2-hydroxy-3-keto-5-methylthiopentenyl-1-phosphate phosphatase